MNTMEDALVEFVEASLKAKADATKAAPMAAYMKTTQPFYGVQKTEREAISREMKRRFVPKSQAEYEAGVRELWKQQHREDQYLALSFARQHKKFVTSTSMGLYEELIRQGAWWDLVDEVATQLVSPVFLAEREFVEPIIKAWIDDECLWIRRAAILSQMKHREKTDSKLLFEFCLRLAPEKEFFIRKAIGWALREYSYTAPQDVWDFLNKNKDVLSPLSYREGARVIRAKGWVEL